MPCNANHLYHGRTPWEDNLGKSWTTQTANKKAYLCSIYQVWESGKPMPKHKKIEVNMSAPSKEFWKLAKELVASSTELELTILRQMAAKEIEARISKFHKKIDDMDAAKKAKKNNLIKSRLKIK